MTITNLVFVTRKPSVSFAEFVKYSEEVHVPLTTRIAGDTMPKSFRRHYTDSSSPSYVGPNRGVDCILEMVWEDEAAVGELLFIFSLFLFRFGLDKKGNYADSDNRAIPGEARGGRQYEGAAG
ncbi:hypothetical protein C8R47DRAFT_1163486 [Mycena vitilis]|nr:hypothetical protein C8R47DRAFT_1163486 [Mycena vitilis]